MNNDLEATASQRGVFLNGKAQIIEMLQLMSKQEKDRILSNIKMRNPSLADELMERSFSFSSLENLRENDMYLITKNVQPQILGVALKNQKSELQRRILSIAPRDYAEEAYQTMTKSISNEKELVKRAQNKIIAILIDLSKKNIINLS